MRLRNWLLTGTSLAVFTLAPTGLAMAQDAELQAAYETYAAAQASGDTAATESALAALTELCIVGGYASVDECIAAITGAAAEPEPQPEPEPAPQPEPQPAPAQEPAPVQEQAPVEEPVPEEPAGPTQEELQAQFTADLNAALQQYQDALNMAAAGDYAGAQPLAAEAETRILQLCTDNGYPSIEACIGQTLPPLPEPEPEPAPAEEPAPEPEPAPAEEPAPAGEQAPAEQPAAQEETPAEEPAVEQPESQPAEQPADQPAEQPADVDPLVQAEADLNTAVELYTVGVGQLQAGDADGQSTIDAANARIAEICTGLGFTDIAECLGQFGLTLPELPAAPVAPPAEPETPVEELPGADEAVTPEAVEVLPEEIAPEEAAPVLDSAKDMLTLEQAAPGGQAAEQPGEQPAEEQPVEEVVAEEPPAPPPASDEEAQAAIEPIEVQSIVAEQGEKVAVEALPVIEPPQNVTIINNVTNVTNNVNVTNNNFTNSGFIFQVGVNLVINNPAQEIDRIYDEDEDEVYYEELSNGRIRETIVRPNGVQIVTVRNRYGEILKRSRIMPDGREYILAYYEDGEEEDFVDWRDPGEDLPPLRLNIPVREYILDADEADEEEVEWFFRQPPVEQVRQIYSIEDVKRSARIRDSVRRLEIGGLTFDTGKATISRSQVGALSKVANAMLAMLEDNPGEVFMIEGHTDAVGSERSNLELSDLRAATVARILTDFYGIPPENLVTQGYGERYLKVRTLEAERLNRRVTIKRITPLVTVASR